MLRLFVYLVCIAAVGGAFAGTYALERTDGSLLAASFVLPATPVPLSLSGSKALNHCTSSTKLYDPQDRVFCGHTPALDRFRLFEIDLSHNRILFYEQGALKKTFPIAYQAAYGKWFQTPTGYFTAGVKKPKFMSSIVPVYMEDAVQLYEDFFIHSIPYYADGTRVTSQFSGGCIRLEDPVAADFYTTIQRGDAIVSYATLDGLTMREGLVAPVDMDHFWVRQRFNSPLKVDWTWRQDTSQNYIQHTGLDLAPSRAEGFDEPDLNVYSVSDGVVAAIVRNGEHDRGLGNTVIVEYRINNIVMYGLYGHLSRIDPSLAISQAVAKGQKIGVVGNTGYGCDYWHVGEDGCDGAGEPDTHVHVEFKIKPVLDSPISDPTCAIREDIHSCVGSTSEDPSLFGYLDPMQVLFSISYEN